MDPLEYQARQVVQHIKMRELDQAKDMAIEGLELCGDNNDEWTVTYTFYLGLIAQLRIPTAESERTISKYRNEAFDYYQKCLRLNPEHVASLNNLGKLYMGMDYHEQAIEAFTRSYRVTGNLSTTTALNLADQHLIMGSSEKARKYLSLVLVDNWEDQSFVQQAVEILSRDQKRGAELLMWEMISQRSYATASAFAIEVVRSSSYSDASKEVALVVWAQATARSQFHDGFVNTGILSELAKELEPGSSSEMAATGLARLYDSLASPVEKYEIWSSNGNLYGPEELTSTASTVFAALLESLGQWFFLNNRLDEARRVYDLAIQYPGNETKPELFTTLADIYQSMGLYDELKEMVSRSTPRLMVAKGDHYREWDLESAYRYHVTLGNVLSAVEEHEGSEGRGVVSARFQLERALELASEASLSYDTVAQEQKPFPVYPRTVNALAELYGRFGHCDDGFALRLDWTEQFIQREEISSANQVFAGITRAELDHRHSSSNLSRYKKLMYTRPWETSLNSSSGFKLVINRIKIIDNRKSRSLRNLFGLFRKLKTNVVLYSIIATNQTKLVRLDELAKIKDPGKKLEIVRENIKQILSASVCRGLTEVGDNEERSFSQEVIFNSRQTPNWLKLTCVAVSAKEDSSSYVREIMNSIQQDQHLQKLTETLSNISRNSEQVQRDFADALNFFLVRILTQYLADNNITQLGTITETLDRARDFPDGHILPAKLVDRNGNLEVYISSTLDSAKPSRVMSLE